MLLVCEHCNTPLTMLNTIEVIEIRQARKVLMRIADGEGPKGITYEIPKGARRSLLSEEIVRTEFACPHCGEKVDLESQGYRPAQRGGIETIAAATERKLEGRHVT